VNSEKDWGYPGLSDLSSQASVCQPLLDCWDVAAIHVSYILPMAYFILLHILWFNFTSISDVLCEWYYCYIVAGARNSSLYYT